MMKEQAGKRSEVRDAEAKAEDNDKRKWMSTAQLWVDNRGSDSDSVVRTSPSVIPVMLLFLFVLVPSLFYFRY